MSPLSRLTSAILISAGCCTGSLAEDSHPFGFAPPEVSLSDFGARALRIADLNEDGREDLLTLNNDRGRIDIYLQRDPDGPPPKGKQPLQPDRWQPVLEDARFERSSVITGNSMYDCVTGDFNQDGHPDIFLTDSQNRGLIYHGPIKSGWAVSERIALEELQASPQNIVWDSVQKKILILAEASMLEVTWDVQSGSYQNRVLFPLHAPGKARGLQLLDVNEDGQSDLIYELSNEPNFNLAIHLNEQGEYGSVQLPFLDPAGRHFRPFPQTPPFALMSIHSRSRVLQKHRINTAPSVENKLDSLDLKILPFRKGSGRSFEFTWAKLQADAPQQLIARMPNEPSLAVSALSGNGTQPRQDIYPIPQGCEWSLAGDFLNTGTDQLILSDADQDFLGIATFRQGRIQFPRELPNEHEWVSACTIQQDGADLLLGVTKEKKIYHARVFQVETPDGQAHSLKELASLRLSDVTRDPYPPLALNATGTDATEYLVCTAYDAPFFLTWDGSALQRLDPSAGFSKGLLKKARPADFMSLPAHDAFPSKWLRLKDRTGQFLKLADDGTITVLDQINLEHPGTLSGLLPLPDQRIGLLNGGKDEVEIHLRDQNGILRFKRTVSLPPLECQKSELKHTPEGLELWVQGPARISRIRPKPAAFRMLTETLFETELEGVNHLVADGGDFNGDGIMDIIAFDPIKTHVLEFLQKKGDLWSSSMHFQVFDTAQNYKGRRSSNTQPREYEIRDVTGDGLTDLIFLLHDRIMVYVQDPVPAN